ncbi:MAG: hypothetical protein MUD14_18230 [Hydrococcus sp. Prado102]|jgi:hypothetical protein|nr:hypothetical protein [Hydrococcus sp. Prado102]
MFISFVVAFDTCVARLTSLVFESACTIAGGLIVLTTFAIVIAQDNRAKLGILSCQEIALTL